MRAGVLISLGFLVLLSPDSANAENHYGGYIENGIDPAARLGVLGVNLAINTAVCGISAAVNDRNVLNDIGVCAAGTTFQYAGMELGTKNAPVLPGIALRLTETGTSIIYNTLEGNSPFHKLQYGAGPWLVEIDTEEADIDFYWRAMPLIGVPYYIADGHKFDIVDSLNYQTFVFHGETELLTSTDLRTGLTVGNVFWYNTDYSKTAAHEFSHVLQYVRMRPFQLLVPDELDVIEEEAHLRIGEDVAFILGTLPQTICTISGTTCARYWWNLIEAEASVMETSYMEQ